MRSFLFRAAALAVVLAPAAAFAQAPIVAPAGTNPPGTAASRALDQAAGTNTSGAYPNQADGTRNNPPGTAVSRATGTTNAAPHGTTHATTPHRAQTTQNNSATRTLDRAAGTNNSGAYPTQSDGMPGNPPGTAVSRTLGTTNTK